MSAFVPPPLDSHQGPAQGFTPPPLSSHEGEKPGAISRAATAFWENTGKPFWDMMMGASRDPAKAKKAVDTFKGLVTGLIHEPSRVAGEFNEAGNSFMRGDVSGGVRHTLGAVPLVGGPALQVAQDIDKGNLPEAVGHSAAMVAPFAAGPAIEAAAPAVETAATATKGALGGAYQAATSPKTMIGAGTAEYLGSHVGLPHGVGAAVVAGPRIVKAAIEGGKAALADRVTAAAESLKPVAASPGEALARESGQDWAKLSPEDRRMLESVARARANAAAQPPAPSQPQPQTAPASAAPVPSKPLAEQLRDELAARNGETGPSPSAPVNTASVPESFSLRAPVRPPLAPAPAQPSPVPAVELQPVSAPTPAPSQAPVITPDTLTSSLSGKSSVEIAAALKQAMTESGTLPPEPAPEVVPPSPETLTSQMRDIPTRTRTQMAKGNARAAKEGKADSGTVGPAYEAAGRLNKAEKLAQALHENGIGFADAQDMTTQHWGEVTKALGIKASKDTVGETLLMLKKMEAKAK